MENAPQTHARASEIVYAALGEKTPRQHQADGTCLICKADARVNEMKGIVRKEYGISAMCGTCQQSVWGHS